MSVSALVPLGRYTAKVAAIAGMDMRKLRHDPWELLTRANQPTLWLLVFGQVFQRARSIPTGGVDYLAFLAPGILAQSVLFVAIFNGISVIWERDLGIVHKFLASPTPRTALVAGKALAAGVKALTQAIVVYAIALAVGVQLAWSPAALAGVVAFILLGAALFSTFSLIVACIVKTRERFMGIGQVLTMPLFFASNAIYPTEIMPGWLQAIAHVNPLTYVVDGLRSLMLSGASSTLGLGRDFAVLAPCLIALVVIGGRMYPRLIVWRTNDRRCGAMPPIHPVATRRSGFQARRTQLDRAQQVRLLGRYRLAPGFGAEEYTCPVARPQASPKAPLPSLPRRALIPSERA